MAVLHEAEVPKAVAVYRILNTTFAARRFHVDDLVAEDRQQGRDTARRFCDGVNEQPRRKDAMDLHSIQGCNELRRIVSISNRGLRSQRSASPS